MGHIEWINKRSALTAVVLLALLLSGCAAVEGGTVPQIDKISVESALLGKAMPVQVYLPPGYSQDARYPVLYFLADYGGTADTVMRQYGAAERAEAMIAAGDIEPLIIVGLSCDRGFGINSSSEPGTFETASGKAFSLGMYADHLCEEVIPYIDAHYRTIAAGDGRFIGGYSMGGFAALHNAFTRPALFSRAGGHSPSLFVGGFPDSTVSDWLYPTEEIRARRDPIHLAREADLGGLRVFLDVETGGADGVLRLHEVLAERGVDVTFMELSLSHGRESCYANMEEYLRFYAGVE